MATIPKLTLEATSGTGEKLSYTTAHMDKIHLTIRRWFNVLDAQDFILNGEAIDGVTMERLVK